MLFFVRRLRSSADRQLRQLPPRRPAPHHGRHRPRHLLLPLRLHRLSPVPQPPGIPYQPLLASAGILGIAIGLGAQSIFKDVLNGILILIEDQYNVGEVVNIAGLKGTVEDLSLRRTTLRDADGTLYIIPNSQIATVSNLSRDYAVATLNVSVDASANPDKVIAILGQVARRARNEPPTKTSPSPTPSSLASTRSKAAPSPIPSSSASAPTNATPFSASSVAASSSPSRKTASLSASIPPTCSSSASPNPTAPPAQQPLIGS